MIPAYIIKKEQDRNSYNNQIQLEIPDNSLQYEEYLRKKQQEEQVEQTSSVIVIDIY